MVAQKLYEAGHITYIRTVMGISASFVKQARAHLLRPLETPTLQKEDRKRRANQASIGTGSTRTDSPSLLSQTNAVCHGM